MVAFLCNKPSVYLTESGWKKDDETGCLRDPADILNYCRKVSRLGLRCVQLFIRSVRCLLTAEV